MAKYYLTDRQKNLIRSLASGLQDGTIETEWSIFRGGDRIIGIMGLGDSGKLWREVWKGVKYSDFDAFSECRFLKRTPTGGYILNEARILDAVEHNFEDDSQAQKTQINISGGDFRNSNLNVASTLNNVQQSIDSVASSDDLE